MKKGKLLGSMNQIHRKKRYEDYFDPEKTYLMTPHSRSLPKKKPCADMSGKPHELCKIHTQLQHPHSLHFIVSLSNSTGH